MTFDEKLLILRKQANLSQEELAQKLGVSRQSVSKWELGAFLPDTEKVIYLSEMFNVSTDYLLKVNISSSELQPATPSISADTTGRKAKFGYIIGLCSVIFASVSLFITYILSKIYPAPIFAYDAQKKLWKVGFNNFIYYHDLQFFLALIFFIFAFGLCLLFHKKIRKLYLHLSEKFMKK
ncbi:MAG: helix-turn-helix transcriptional regulator [Oscillospiraceae bacterium]